MEDKELEQVENEKIEKLKASIATIKQELADNQKSLDFYREEYYRLLEECTMLRALLKKMKPLLSIYSADYLVEQIVKK